MLHTSSGTRATGIALLLFPFPPRCGVASPVTQCGTISSGKWPKKNEWLKNNNCLRSPTLPDRVCAIVFEQGSCTTLTSSGMELRWCICSAATRWMDRLAFPSVFVSFVYFILAKLFSFSSIAHIFFSSTRLH